MEILDNNHVHVILRALDQQRLHFPRLCDVRLTSVDGKSLHAHRGVLAACSGYFHVLFTSSFHDSERQDFKLNDCSHQTAKDIINFMYTGKICILPSNLEEILSISDFLCVERLKDYCVKYMWNNITQESCVSMKYLCEKFNLKDLSEKITRFISPRISELLVEPELLSLPYDFIRRLLTSSEFNYVNEQIICNFLYKWIQKDYTARKGYVDELFSLVELSYLPKPYIREKILDTRSDIYQEFDCQRKKSFAERSSEDLLSPSVDLLVCRSRSVTLGQEAQLLIYIPEDDEWHFLKTPQPHILDGLESLITHGNAIYCLVSKTEDMYGYMHYSREAKYFHRFDLDECVWENLASPETVREACRLVSHANNIYVIDRTGLLEEYDVDSGKWVAVRGCVMFDNPNSTWYILPMPLDKNIFMLRVFSSGYAYSYDQISYSIHKFDTVARTQEKLAEIEACELGMEEGERIHAYVTKHSCITMKNELGQPRIGFDLVNLEFTLIEPQAKMPDFITDVWGSVQTVGKVYFVGKSIIDCPTFMFYDFIRSRFKATTEPPTYLSGLMCHVTVPRETCRKLVNQ